MENKLETRQFLECFFNNGNQINLDAIESTDGSARMLKPWIIRLEQNLPSVLPCKHDQGTDWYGIAQSEVQLRSLGEDLTAFIGPTGSTFRGQRAQLDLNNPIEASVHAFTKGLAFKFQGVPDRDGRSRKVWQALELMRQVLDRRVLQPYQTPRATGRVLRDFYMALQACDRPAAEVELNYLQVHNRLDPLNLLFLRVRMLSELEVWEELLALPELADLLGSRRPYGVTQALIRAVYQQELYRFEVTRAVQSAVTYFHESILPLYGNLYTSRANSHQPETVKSFMLLAVGCKPADVNLQNELLNLPGLNPEDLAYLQQLANLLPNSTPSHPPTIADPLKAAEEAAQQFKWDQVIALASEIPGSLQKARLLFHAFYEVQTLNCQREALIAFEQLNLDEQNTLRKTRLGQECLIYLQDSVSLASQIPTNWIEWLERLIDYPEWEQALDIARRGEQEWDVSCLLNKHGTVQQLKRLLEKASGQVKIEAVLSNALPHLLNSFQKDEQYPNREFISIYEFLVDLIAITTVGGDPDLLAFNELSNTIFSLGINSERYEEVIGYAIDLWSQYGSPAKIDWMLDFINILVIQPSLSINARNQLISTVATSLRQYMNRIDNVQWDLLIDLLKELDLKDSFPDLPPTSNIDGASYDLINNSPLQKLRNKSILIYTLTKPVAQRVKAIIENTCTQVKVHLSHAKGGSDQLKSWILNDDFVVMVTASAKHAATYFIEDHCSEDKLLRVNTKGSASLIREIQAFLGKSS
jgi:NADH:ubiquinone oxidoreductase subunit